MLCEASTQTGVLPTSYCQEAVYIKANLWQEETTATKDAFGFWKPWCLLTRLSLLREAAFRWEMKSSLRASMSAPRPCPKPVVRRRAGGLERIGVRGNARPYPNWPVRKSQPPHTHRTTPPLSLRAQGVSGSGQWAAGRASRTPGRPCPPSPRLCPPVLPHGAPRAERPQLPRRPAPPGPTAIGAEESAGPERKRPRWHHCPGPARGSPGGSQWNPLEPNRRERPGAPTRRHRRPLSPASPPRAFPARAPSPRTQEWGAGGPRAACASPRRREWQPGGTGAGSAPRRSGGGVAAAALGRGLWRGRLCRRPPSCQGPARRRCVAAASRLTPSPLPRPPLPPPPHARSRQCWALQPPGPAPPLAPSFLPAAPARGGRYRPAEPRAPARGARCVCAPSPACARSPDGAERSAQAPAKPQLELKPRAAGQKLVTQEKRPGGAAGVEESGAARAGIWSAGSGGSFALAFPVAVYGSRLGGGNRGSRAAPSVSRLHTRDRGAWHETLPCWLPGMRQFPAALLRQHPGGHRAVAAAAAGQEEAVRGWVAERCARAGPEPGPGRGEAKRLRGGSCLCCSRPPLRGEEWGAPRGWGFPGRGAVRRGGAGRRGRAATRGAGSGGGGVGITSGGWRQRLPRSPQRVALHRWCFGGQGKMADGSSSSPGAGGLKCSALLRGSASCRVARPTVPPRCRQTRRAWWLPAALHPALLPVVLASLRTERHYWGGVIGAV